MNASELLRLGADNLVRSKLRTALTTAGVTIGIGCMVSLVSFGTGMQKNVSEMFYERDLFNTMVVAPEAPDLDRMMSEGMGAPGQSARVLDDSVLATIRGWKGVEIAFPEIQFPVRLEIDGRSTRSQIRAMPADMARFPPFSELEAGKYFGSDTTQAIVLSTRVLEDLGWRLVGNRPVQGKTFVDPDTLIGRTITVTTSLIDPRGIRMTPLGLQQPAVREHVTRLKIAGIVESRGGFAERMIGSAIIPIGTAGSIPRPAFGSVWDLLSRGESRGHSSVYIRVRSLADVDSVDRKIKAMGFSVFSLANQFSAMKRGFMMVDLLLGVIGMVALIVAGLGIANTMVMSVLERTRDIGIMQAIGASEEEIQGIFFAEAGVIGIVGGVFGILLGWVVTLIASAVANAVLARQGEEPVAFFYIPIWLVLGGLAFSLVVSLTAGLYPAIRASRVDPTHALRHE